MTNQPDREREALIERLREDHADTDECEHGFLLHRDRRPNAVCLARDLRDAVTLLRRDADRAGEGERVAVPRTPTIDMMGAGIEEWGILDDCEAEVSRIWEAMVNAAPATPLLDDETVERN